MTKGPRTPTPTGIQQLEAGHAEHPNPPVAKKRRCMKCRELFNSHSAGNRLCVDCRKVIRGWSDGQGYQVAL